MRSSALPAPQLSHPCVTNCAVCFRPTPWRLRRLRIGPVRATIGTNLRRVMTTINFVQRDQGVAMGCTMLRVPLSAWLCLLLVGFFPRLPQPRPRRSRRRPACLSTTRSPTAAWTTTRFAAWLPEPSAPWLSSTASWMPGAPTASDGTHACANPGHLAGNRHCRPTSPCLTFPCPARGGYVAVHCLLTLRPAGLVGEMMADPMVPPRVPS